MTGWLAIASAIATVAAIIVLGVVTLLTESPRARVSTRASSIVGVGFVVVFLVFWVLRFMDGA